MRPTRARRLSPYILTPFDGALFNFREAPEADRIGYVVDIAVKTFLAAYRVR